MALTAVILLPMEERADMVDAITDMVESNMPEKEFRAEIRKMLV